MCVYLVQDNVMGPHRKLFSGYIEQVDYEQLTTVDDCGILDLQTWIHAIIIRNNPHSLKPEKEKLKNVWILQDKSLVVCW
jgi:hypothetical protein